MINMKLQSSNVGRRTFNVEVKSWFLSWVRSSALDVQRSTFAFLFVTLAVLSIASRGHAQVKLYDTKYYSLYTDVDPDDEKEAAIRMTKMAEEYHERTQGFAGQIREKFPFYLFKSAEDYYRAGGMQGSAGVFLYNGNGGKLMAIAGRKSSTQTWQTVQHEGFHQFAHAVIGGHLPVWLDEGLAEYFGESIFTGDGFVTGIIPPWRLSRLKGEIADHQTRSFGEIMHLSDQEWSDHLNIKNYDQAWSMVYFLVHGDDQKYQAGLTGYIRDISQRKNADTAWNNNLAANGDLQDRWQSWWTDQPENPTSKIYGRAAVATMTSFVARAFAQKQTFPDFAAFHAAVDGHSLKISNDDWLPDSLITTAFRLYGSSPHWELQTGLNKQPVVALTLGDGTLVTGSFVLQGVKVQQVKVDVDDMAPVLQDAQALLNEGKKDRARTMVVSAMRNDPKSALIAEARRFLQGCR